MMQLTNYFLPFQALTQIAQTYLASQKVTTPFLFSNLISIGISIYFGKKYIIDMGYSEIGFCYTRIVQEIFNMLYATVILFIFADKESLVSPSIKLLTENFGSYFWYTFKTALSFYGECLSFELNTYFAALLHNLTELAAFISIINCVVYVFFISIGFANTFRTNIGNTLGAGNVNKARKDSIIYTIIVFLFSVVFCSFFIIFNKEIAVIYTGENNATPIVAWGLVVYCANVFPTFILYSQSSLLRYLNKNNLAVQTTAILMPILVLIISGFFAFKMEMGAIGLIWGFFGSKVVAMTIFFIVIYKCDWRECYKQFKKSRKTNDTLSETVSVSSERMI
jgi:Na+-driven multidrug efflux pump